MFVFDLILLYAICFVEQYNVSALNKSDIKKDIISVGNSNLNVFHDNLNALIESEARSNKSDIGTWFTNMEVLIKASNKAMKNIRKNIKNNNLFDPNFKRLLDEMFKDVGGYENTLQSELKKSMEKKQFDASKKSMFNIMNKTISLIEKEVKGNLNQMNLIMPTKWYKNLKDKMLRQEVKAATGYVAKKMCEIGVCKKTKIYSDYVKIWLRYLLNVKSKALHEFLTYVPEALEKHKHFVKSNAKFRKTINYILNSDITTQKDCLAFLDEVLVNPKIFDSIPKRAKKSATMLLVIFGIIDDNYDVNDENKKQLKTITNLFGKMLEGKYIYPSGLLDKIMENIQINNKIWPLKEQSKLDHLWAEFIH